MVPSENFSVSCIYLIARAHAGIDLHGVTIHDLGPLRSVYCVLFVCFDTQKAHSSDHGIFSSHRHVRSSGASRATSRRCKSSTDEGVGVDILHSLGAKCAHKARVYPTTRYQRTHATNFHAPFALGAGFTSSSTSARRFWQYAFAALNSSFAAILSNLSRQAPSLPSKNSRCPHRHLSLSFSLSLSVSLPPSLLAPSALR